MSIEQWNRLKELTWYKGGAELSLDFSSVEEASQWFADEQELFQKGVSELQAIEAGETINTDEGRMVGHYWLRDSSLCPDQDLTTQIEEALDAIEKFSKRIRGEERFRNILVVGIGGSALGPQLVADALRSPDQLLQFWSLDNTDPDGMITTLNEISSLWETLVLVISKSGGTKETRNAMLIAERAFAAQGLSFADHAVAVTGEGSKLDQYAKDNKWKATFPMWDWVGGRTSLWSAVGLLPFSLMGFDIQAMLSGAKEMDQYGRAVSLKDNPAAMLGLVWFKLAQTAKDMVVLPYKDRLLLMSRYLQQLVMESLGKELDRDGNKVHEGLAVYGNKGSTDQHAYIQQLRDGRNNFFALFIEVLSDFTRQSTLGGLSHQIAEKDVEEGVTAGDYLQGFYLGTRQALEENGRGSVTVTVKDLNAHTLGMLIALFERAVSFYAAYANINAYHQPGVEAGKKAAGAVIELKKSVMACLEKSSEGITVEAIAQQIGSEEFAHIHKILERLAALGEVKSTGEDLFEKAYSRS